MIVLALWVQKLPQLMRVPYLTYFNLQEEPFSTVPNPRYFFLTPIHSTALGKTEFTVDAKKGLTIVFGDTGTGKSTLARLLHQKFLDKSYISVRAIQCWS